MTDIYRPHVDSLCRDEIEIDEFERRCRQSWIEENGPVPDGRHLFVGVMDHRLIVGHAALPPARESCVWKFKSLDGREIQNPTPMITIDLEEI